MSHLQKMEYGRDPTDIIEDKLRLVKREIRSFIQFEESLPAQPSSNDLWNGKLRLKEVEDMWKRYLELQMQLAEISDYDHPPSGHETLKESYFKSISNMYNASNIDAKRS